MADLYLSSFTKEDKPSDSTTKPVASGNYAFDSTLFRAYAGSYSLDEAPGFVLKFWRDGSSYYTQATGQPSAAIFPSSDSTFFLKVVEASVVFHKAKDGKVNRITLKQNGNHPGTRVNAQETDAIDAAQFAGQYYSPELETIYTIAKKGDALKLIHVHHGEADLKIVGKDRLNAPWWFVQNIEIVRNPSGVITGIKMSNGRVVNLWLKKLPDDFAANNK